MNTPTPAAAAGTPRRQFASDNYAGVCPEALRWFVDDAGAPRVDVVINTMAFAMGGAAEPDSGEHWAVPALVHIASPRRWPG